MKPKVDTINPQGMAQAKSSFDNVNRYKVNFGGFGTSTNSISKNKNSKNGSKQYTSNFKFSQPMQNIQNTATQGLQNSLGGLNTPYAQQLSNIDSGNNAAYNYQHAQNQLAANNAYADLQARMSGSGLAGSTVLGGFAAQQARDAQLVDLALRQQAIAGGQQYDLNNAQANSGTLGQLYGFASGQAGMNNGNAMSGLGMQNATSLANAQMQNQAMMANQQYQNQANQQASSNWGSLIGAGLGLGAAAMTGGMSSGMGAVRGFGQSAYPHGPSFSGIDNQGFMTNAFF